MGHCRENASKVMIELLGSYTESTAAQAKDDARRCVVTSLADPSTYLLDHLLTLKPVQQLKGDKIHDVSPRRPPQLTARLSVRRPLTHCGTVCDIVSYIGAIYREK